MRANCRSLLSIVLTFSLFLISANIIIICSSSCGRKNDKMIHPPSTLLPPEPPKPPTMAGGDTIWNFAGQLPKLPGNQEALYEYIGKNLQYPVSAKEKGVQGRVIVKFCVTKKGEVINHQVINSVSPDLDTEALRVIKTITAFEPGYQDGKAVSVWYEVPISFVLK